MPILDDQALDISIVDEEPQKPKKMSGVEAIKAYIEGFDEMIKFMDFSFERAYSQKDKEFMIAYREHIKEIQKEIDKLKNESNDQRYQELKK